MQMAKKDRPALTAEERAEKFRLSSLIKKHSPSWQESNPGQGKLTQARLGDLVTQLRGKDLGQGGIWHYVSPESYTRLNPEIVQAIAHILGFDPGEVSPRFKPKPYAMPAATDIDAAIMAEVARLPIRYKELFLAQIAAAADSIKASSPEQ